MPRPGRPLHLEWLMLNGAIRYWPVLAILRQRGLRRILDVGCGDGGLPLYDPSLRVVGCDLAFNRPLPPLEAVVGRGGRLPFRDAAFEAVISLDTLEHVPAAERAPFIRDLARVGSGVLILGLPCGRLARWTERLLDCWYALLGIATPDFLAEHQALRLPERAEVQAVLDSLNLRCTVLGNEHLLLHLAVMMGESLAWARPKLIGLARDRTGRTARWLAFGNARPTYRQLFVVELDRPGA